MILISSVRQFGMKPRTLLRTIIFRISRASIKQHGSRFGVSMSLSLIKKCPPTHHREGIATPPPCGSKISSPQEDAEKVAAEQQSGTNSKHRAQ